MGVPYIQVNHAITETLHCTFDSWFKHYKYSSFSHTIVL